MNPGARRNWLSLAFRGGGLTTLGQNPGRSLDASAEKSSNGSSVSSSRGVRELEMRLFDPALSIEPQREILDRNRSAREDPVEHRLQNFAGFRPHLHARAPQGQQDVCDRE